MPYPQVPAPFHYILTLAAYPRGLGQPAAETYSGIVAVEPAASDAATFDAIYRDCAARFREAKGIAGEPHVVHFSLVPDQLTGHS